MAFDLENAVQQGFNRDVTTNDFHVQARNLEIKLDDAGGVREFRVLDSDNVAVVVADSDGYLAVAGNAEVLGGHLRIRGENLTNTEFITLEDQAGQVSVFLFDANPNGLYSAPMGSFGTSYNDGYLYTNLDGSMQWERIALYSQIATVATTTVTLQNAYDNDPDGGNANIVTNATDGAIVISGSEKLQVTATGGIDLDTVFDMDGSTFDVDLSGAATIDAAAASNFTVTGADLTLSTVTSGNVIVTVPSGGTGNFIVNEGAGTNYIATNTADNELVLGDTSPEVVVLVASDFTVDGDAVIQGDLTVNGVTTTVNTTDLYVEDRMMRINVGAAPSFNGTTGIEAEVGSDGYVEFHWDDNSGRWEISIDRSTTPETQTFRPLPYLADDAATLDLSSIGTSLTPNTTSGAAVINTNSDNFFQTFGPDMFDNSVQAALEAIDGYFITLNAFIDSSNDVTLHTAYKNDADGGDATITTDATDGDVVIAGTEQFRVTAAGGVNVNTTGSVNIDADAASNFTVDGNDLTLSTTTSGNVVINGATSIDMDSALVTIDSTGAISLDAAAASNFTTSAGALTLDGASGVVLDGNGSNVIPASNNTDTLGSATNGWIDIFLNNANHGGAVVGLNDAGGAGVHNSTAGADLVGTNALNFSTTFGINMTENTVQAALEAIDGYLQYLTVGISTPTTLQIAYNNDVDGGDATIFTDATDGSVVIAGTESFRVTATGGIDLDSGFDMDATGGQSFDVNLTGGGGFSLDAYSAASNVTVDGADLVVSTTTSGVLTLSGATGIVLDGTGDNVRPATNNTDTLGTSLFGWADVYLRNVENTATVALRAAGSSSIHNSTAGADAVGTNSLNFATFGPDMVDNSVQGALEAIDAYFQDFSLNNFDTTYTKTIGLDINGGILNGVVKVTTVSGTPGLAYPEKGTSRTSWTIPVPTDWDGISDFTVTVIWSPEDSSAGDVEWRLEYKVLALTELASAAATNDDFTQAAGGTGDALQSTGLNLTILGTDIQTTDALIVVNIVRRGDAAGDTYTKDARVHLVQYSYSAQNIV